MISIPPPPWGPWEGGEAGGGARGGPWKGGRGGTPKRFYKAPTDKTKPPNDYTKPPKNIQRVRRLDKTHEYFTQIKVIKQ